MFGFGSVVRGVELTCFAGGVEDLDLYFPDPCFPPAIDVLRLLVPLNAFGMRAYFKSARL